MNRITTKEILNVWEVVIILNVYNLIKKYLVI